MYKNLIKNFKIIKIVLKINKILFNPNRIIKFSFLSFIFLFKNSVKTGKACVCKLNMIVQNKKNKEIE